VKSPLLLFALKCSVILYFAACSGIADYTTAVSATPLVTKGCWKISVFTEAGNNQASDLSGYCLTFDPAGKVKVTKDGKEISGNWSEDDILKRITISLDTNDPQLIMLNNYWNISSVSKTEVTLQNPKDPSNGRLQLTSL
jgi:hypothetical protein